MKYILSSVAIATALTISAAPVRADAVDMSKLTCSELIDMKSDDAGVVLFWLHGYFGGEAHDPKLDLSDITEAGRKLGAYCAEHKKQTVFGAIKSLSK